MKGWSDFYAGFLGTFVFLTVGVVVDWPHGVARNAAAVDVPDIGVWWAITIGLVGGVLSSVVAGVLTAAGRALLAGLGFGLLSGAMTGTGLRGSPEELALGLASLIGILGGPVLLGRRLRAVMAEGRAYHNRR